MTRQEVFARLQAIFRDVFEDPALILQPQTTANDIPDWDFVSQAKIVIACESAFNIRLKAREINILQSVDEIVDRLWAATQSVLMPVVQSAREISAVQARGLRQLKPSFPQVDGRRAGRAATVLFWLSVLALALQFFLPYVVLDAIGINTTKVKVHPATIVVLLGAIYALMCGVRPLTQRCREAPGLILFAVTVPVLAVYSIFSVGFSGSAVFADTFWSAGLLAIMLETSTTKQKRILGGLLIAVCVFNVGVAVYESLTLTTWFPLVIDPDATLTDIDVDFRPNAFFGHPLNAAIITSMAVFLLYAMRLRIMVSAPIFGILLIGLLAYGGRTALGVTLVITAAMAFFKLMSGIVRRNLTLDFVLAVLAGLIIIPIVVTIILTQTSIADRIIDSLSYDDGSAQARATQWEIFKLLSLKDWIFGISADNLLVLKYQIGLGGKDTDIENFWFLMLLDLGVIGFATFLTVFMIFLHQLGRMSRNINGWLLVIAALIIDSGSNSLGVKSNDLFIEVAFIVAISGYADYVRQPRVVSRVPRSRMMGFGQPQGGLSLASVPRLRGLRALATRPF